MTVRTHTHPAHTPDMCTASGTGHMHRSGYVRASGADTYVRTHTAPVGRTYVVRDNTTDPDTATALDVWCVPTYTDTTGNALTDRYGMPVATIDGPTAFVSTVDGMGYASPGTDTYGAPTVPATDTTPREPADMVAPSNESAPTCMACGDTATPLASVAVGTHITVHVHGGDGTGRTITRTYTGTVAHDVIDVDGTPHTVARVDLDNGGSWSTPRADYVVHVDTPAPVGAPTPDDAPTDDDTYVSVFGRPVPANVARSMGVVDPAPWVGMIPGRTYTGTSYRGTDYTVSTDGTITTRTYADGTVTRADANHMWCAAIDGDTDDGTVTYVVAEGTYWRSDAEGNYDAVSSASWPMVATCMHSFGGYGACIAPVGHPHTDHLDAHGHRFNGPAMARYGTPIGPVAPDTYTTPTRVVGGRYMANTDDGVSRLHDDTYRLAAMFHAYTTTGNVDTYEAVTHAETMAAYRTMVHAMVGIYTPSHVPTERERGTDATNTPGTYTALLDGITVAEPTTYAAMWTDLYGTTRR